MLYLAESVIILEFVTYSVQCMRIRQVYNHLIACHDIHELVCIVFIVFIRNPRLLAACHAASGPSAENQLISGEDKSWLATNNTMYAWAFVTIAGRE